jgi:hypothetical protein
MDLGGLEIDVGSLHRARKEQQNERRRDTAECAHRNLLYLEFSEVDYWPAPPGPSPVPTASLNVRGGPHGVNGDRA